MFSAITPLTLLPRNGPVRYDPLRVTAPVAQVTPTPTPVAGTTALAAYTFQGTAAQARAHPGAVRWATTGVGTTGYRELEMVADALRLHRSRTYLKKWPARASRTVWATSSR